MFGFSPKIQAVKSHWSQSRNEELQDEIESLHSLTRKLESRQTQLVSLQVRGAGLAALAARLLSF